LPSIFVSFETVSFEALGFRQGFVGTAAILLARFAHDLWQAHLTHREGLG
jgi:hypothetical protein